MFDLTSSHNKHYLYRIVYWLLWVRPVCLKLKSFGINQWATCSSVWNKKSHPHPQHTHTHNTHTHTHTHTHTYIFHAWLLHDRADGWVSKVFVSTDGRRACRRGVIGSTMGAYPRDTGSNPVEGNGHFFPLIPSALSFVFLWHASSDSAEVLADAWCRGPADRS